MPGIRQAPQWATLAILMLAAPIAARAAGEHIRLERIDGRDWLVDPVGGPFFPHGVNHIGQHGRGAGATAVARACKALGFNAYGYGCPPELHGDMPYLESWNDLVPISIHRSGGTFRFLDIFDAEVQRRIAEQIAFTCAENRDDHNLIGYLWTDLAAWPLKNTKRANWVEFCRALPAAAAGKRAYVEFLKAEYGGDFAAFQAVYHVAATGWESLPGATFPTRSSGEKQAGDDLAFLRIIARQYFKVLGEATRKNDPNHLVFGDRFLFSTIVPEVIEEMLPYVDAIAIQPNYAAGFPRAQFDKVHDMTKKPVIICDFAIRFKDGDKDIRGGKVEKDDAIAGKYYAEYIREALATPYIIGALWCNLIDSEQPGKDGIKQGLFLDGLKPRPALHDQIRKLNDDLQEIPKGQRRGT
jgi:hypothetical protein